MESDKITEFSASNSYIMIPTGACYNDKLADKPKSLLLLGQIVSMLNVTGDFYASNKEMAKRLRCSTRTVQTYLDLLEEEKLITRKIERNSYGEVIRRKISAGKELSNAFSFGWKTENTEGKGTLQSEIHNTPREIHNTTPREARNTPLVKHASYKDNSIIDHNNKTNTNIRSVKNQEKEFASDFEVVWQEYPKKQGKKDALRHYIAWRKASPDNTNDFLLKKLNEYKNYINFNHIEFRYIKNGSTWFNGGYDDDYSIGGSNNGSMDKKGFGYDELLQPQPNDNAINYNSYN